MTVRVRITGKAKTRAALAKLTTAARAAAEDVVEEWADDVGDMAEDLVPKDTTYLESQIERRVNKPGLEADVGVWDDQAYYGEFVELGTSSMEAQPWLLPSFEANRDIEPRLRDALERHLR